MQIETGATNKKEKPYDLCLFFLQSMQNVKNPAQLNTKHARLVASKIGQE
jgi:hypothetical protein